MKAIIIGATGLVGNQLLQLLAEDERITQIAIFSRRTTGIQHTKAEEHIIDFEKPEEWQHLVTGDIFFSALGTTLKIAGSKDNQYKIDHTYQYRFAETAANNGVPVYVLVSAPYADPASRFFYQRMKGKLEHDIKKLSFSSINIIQPGLLYGGRKESRPGETAGYYVLSALNKIGLLRDFRPIHGRKVAMAMLNVAMNARQGINTFSPGEVFVQAGNPN